MSKNEQSESRTDRDDADTEQKIEELGDEWGYVVITHRPDYNDNFRWVVANHTDEGLGPDEPLEARGKTLEEALNKALNGDYYERF